jgi:hypothetical protein
MSTENKDSTLYLRPKPVLKKLFDAGILHRPQFKKTFEKSSKKFINQTILADSQHHHFMQQYKFFSFCHMVADNPPGDNPHIVRKLSRKQFRERLYHLGIDYSDCFEYTCKIFYNPDRVIEEDLKEIEDDMRKNNFSEEEIRKEKEEQHNRIIFKFNIMIGNHFGFFEINNMITEILTKYPKGDMFERLKLY